MVEEEGRTSEDIYGRSEGHLVGVHRTYDLARGKHDCVNRLLKDNWSV